jgi:hypothetical protein
MIVSEMYDRVVDALKGEAEIGEGRGFGSSALKVNGKIFAMLNAGRLVVKLPRGRVHDLVANDVGEPFDTGGGRVMKEWVALKPSSEAEWLAAAREARDFVRTAASS